jgi:2-amino-4-hydroxy-6-hydroxymethyldihydropteridine diphosphokinase
VPTAAIALGSNLGDRAAHLRAAFAALGSLPRTTLLAASSFFETAPVGPIPQGPYLNAAAILSTDLSPRELLTHLQSIETSRGRDRSASRRWGPRTLDLDLLVHGRLTVDEPGLTIPHQHLRERAFVLVPLASIAPDQVIPASPVGPPISVADALVALRDRAPMSSDACTLFQAQ